MKPCDLDRLRLVPRNNVSTSPRRVAIVLEEVPPPDAFPDYPKRMKVMFPASGDVLVYEMRSLEVIDET